MATTAGNDEVNAVVLNCNDTDYEVVVKEGWLMKETSFWHKQKQRWLVLTKGHLYAFKQKVEFQQEYKRKGKKCASERIDLREFNHVKTKHGSKDYDFELTSKKSHIRFIGKSYYEAEDWIVKIKAVHRWIHTDWNKPGKPNDTPTVSDPGDFISL
mmetsp:Transcript_58749/g.93389  ORF Transcript_58749/g.93389 Transcript_58749/m.93389 type:complete len:156 (-) Transcript_58749:130-597(-)